MRSHAPQYSTQGSIRFSQTRTSTKDDAPPTQTVITGRLTGLTPNQKHAFHIHELGDLSDGCVSLAGHYNPWGETHGGPESCHRHVGDLGNIQANEEGVAEFEFVDNKIHLIGPHSIIGRSCVVHLFADDLGDGHNAESLKTGNAGPRIACGVVGRAIT